MTTPYEPFVDDPRHIRSLDRQRFVVIRAPGTLAAAYGDVLATYRDRLRGRPVSYPARAHVTLAAFAADTPLAGVQALVAAWAPAVAPLRLEIERIGTFPPPFQIVIAQIRRHSELVTALATLRAQALERRLAVATFIPVERWTFHMTVAYATALDAAEWRDVEAFTETVSAPTSCETATAAEIVAFDEGREYSGGVYALGAATSPSDRDPFGGRVPTSHERMTGRPWDASYHDGPAPWDIGQPQPAIVRLAASGAIASPVLDVGCGTGENALHVASLGSAVLGVDVAETALDMARAKAARRRVDVEFAAADAFELQRLSRTFATVLDCGMFHTCDADERPRYAASLAAVVARGGMLYVLCFSDEGPDTGPHPVSRADLTAVFAPDAGWRIVSIEADRVLTRFNDTGAPAWFAVIERQIK